MRIAALHNDAASAEETGWPKILTWYDDLVALTQDPVRQAARARAAWACPVSGSARGT
jgi:predicted RNA polymerase sigma factor